MLQRRSGHLREQPERNDLQASAPRKKHNVTLKGREHLTIEGVVNVESFDRTEILLETEQGVLLVRGTDLNIKELALEGVGLVVTGFVESLEYQAERLGKQGRGLLGKLFK